MEPNSYLYSGSCGSALPWALCDSLLVEIETVSLGGSFGQKPLLGGSPFRFGCRLGILSIGASLLQATLSSENWEVKVFIHFPKVKACFLHHTPCANTQILTKQSNVGNLKPFLKLPANIAPLPGATGQAHRPGEAGTRTMYQRVHHI